MTDEPQNTNDARHSIYLRSHDQKTLAAVASVLFVAGVFSTTLFAWRNGGIRHIEKLPSRTIAFEVDLNKADWAEISAMPNIGPSVAKAIIAHREKHGPFASQQELLQVPGVGEFTLQQMQPHLNGLPVGGYARVAQRADE